MIAGGPVIGIGVACGVGVLVILHLDKASNYSVYEKLVTLGQAKLSFLQKLVSKALSDGSISESEFEAIINEFETYEQGRLEITGQKRFSKD